MPESPFKENDMAYKGLIAALGTLLAASQALASQPEPSPQTGAPPASPNARYCLRVDPITGSRMETIRCETRERWAMLEVDLDEEWAKEGVRVIDPQQPNT